MKKKAERIVAGILSLSMLMSICSTSVLAETVDLGESTPTTTTYVLDPDRVVTLESMGGAPVAPVALGTDPADPADDPAADPADPGEAGDPVADTEPSLKVEVDEDDGSVDVTVEDRPEATPANPDTEWHPSLEITEEDAEELGKEEISASADGEEHFTSEGPVKDGADRVIQDDQTIEGSEKIEITVTEEVKKDPEGTDGPIDTVESGKVGADGEGVTVEANPNDPTESVSKSETWDMSEGDLRDLVEKPKAPSEDDGWVAEDENTSTKSNTTTAEDGTVTKTEEMWTRNEYKGTVDDQLVAGYMETTTVKTTETGAIDPDLSKKPENAEDITDENDRVGYTYTTVEVDEQGVRTETTYTVFPEQGTYSKTTTTTTTKLTYAKQTEQGTITISDVIASEGDNHGNLSGAEGKGNIQGPQADMSKSPGYTSFNESAGLRDNVTEGGTASGAGNSDFVFKMDDGTTVIDVWAASVYNVNTTGDKDGNKKEGHPTLYIVRSPKKDENGEIVPGEYVQNFVYCVDRGQALDGQGYNLENLKDAEYFNSEEWDKIESIAVNGYWGVANKAAGETEETFGSLGAFKEMLKEENRTYWTDERLAMLNDGMALTVTQAAIWKYASASKNTTADGATVEDPDAIKQNPFFDTKVAPGEAGQGWATGSKPATAEQALLYQAYKDLIGSSAKKLENSGNTSTDLIDKEDITNVKVTVNSKLKEESVAAGEDLYDTKLSFTLEVEPSRINSDDLQVTVTVGEGINKKEYTYTLPKAAGDGETVGRTDNTYEDGSQDVTYVLKGITMPDGTNVSINLTGTQELGKSAYLLTAEGGYSASQSFVGIFEGTRDVNVGVSFEFKADQPEATVIIETTEEQVVEQTQQTSWSSSWLSKIFYPVKPTEPDEPTPDKPKEEPKKPEPEEPDSPDGEPQDGAFVIYPENTDNVIMPEENKKRVESVPKTGDDASVWMIMGLLSMAGLVVINLPKKKMEH